MDFSKGFTRRGVLGLWAGAGALLAGASGLFAGGEAPLEQQLTQALARLAAEHAPRQGPMQFDLLALTEEAHPDGIALQALVRLTWSPGMRQRRVQGAGTDGPAALEDLLRRLPAAFDGALPDPHGSWV